MRTAHVVLLCLLLFSLGVYFGVFITSRGKDVISGYKEQHSGQQRLTNKLLDFDIPPSNELGDYKQLLTEEINKSIQNQMATQVGVYFRDLNNGPWIGVNHDQKFVPASILKVPLMMVYLKKAESDPALLKKKFLFDEQLVEQSGITYYQRKEWLEVGKEYTVEELLNRMIIYSDNDAVFLLASNIDVNIQQELYKKLGIELPTDNFTDEVISPRQIGSFFRVLYNATYLNEQMSEKALQLLTEADFDKGLVAGVPNNVVIAQKFGERASENGYELHDCGIVYFPDHPYVLCIMTRGMDINKLSEVIKNISRLTYEKVKKSN